MITGTELTNLLFSGVQEMRSDQRICVFAIP